MNSRSDDHSTDTRKHVWSRVVSHLNRTSVFPCFWGFGFRFKKLKALQREREAGLLYFDYCIK